MPGFFIGGNYKIWFVIDKIYSFVFMQRGIRVYQSLLFTETAIATAAPEKKFNGRDPALVEARNKLIATRYYYYVKLIRRNYPDTISALQAEFFLSDIQISRIISEEGATLHLLKQENPNAKALAGKYPFMVW
jgi:hypothetical protein